MDISVFIITYNHEQYIKKALDSVLMQDFQGEWEIVIGEDCSTDATREVLNEYKKTYPEKINLILREKNLGMIKNGIETYRECRGKYVAILEGDDYWTSENKLKKQYDFMEKNPELSCSFHNINVLDSENETIRFLSEKMKNKYDLSDIVSRNIIPSCSIMYRNLYDEPPEWFLTMPMGDWPTLILHAEWGPIGYLDEVMATYRVHHGGVWSAQKRYEILNSSIYAAHTIDNYLNHKFSAIMRKKISLWEMDKAKIMVNDGCYVIALRDISTAIIKSPINLSHYVKLFKRFLYILKN